MFTELLMEGLVFFFYLDDLHMHPVFTEHLQVPGIVLDGDIENGQNRQILHLLKANILEGEIENKG